MEENQKTQEDAQQGRGGMQEDTGSGMSKGSDKGSQQGAQQTNK